MEMSKKIPTIQDVARQARVSAATVSRVLSSPERVSELTRARVHEAIRTTGYTLNQAARTLRMQRARTILAALPGIGNPFYSTVLEAAVRVATARGYGLLVTGRLGDNPARWLMDYFVSNRADGMLLFDGLLDTRILDGVAGDSRQMPMVAAYDELPDVRINSVVTDNFQAAERAVQHLLDYGHREIGHITGPTLNMLPNERHSGYKKALVDNGLAVREEWIVPGDYSMEGGAKAAEHFLSLKHRPTAIFAANDETAIGLITRLRAGGIECPRDMSVIGFDDIYVAQNYFPALTTMRQPRDEIGRIAAEMLINILEGTASSADPVHVVMKSELVIRASTGRIGPG
jgi:LacI family transcriptional regulator, repressor for deo operon, udp, cdd, tsx, nupC, and nupG